MDLSIKRQKLTCDELWQEISAQQNIETSITLPDYCSDIKRILKCILRPGINNVSLSGENISSNEDITVERHAEKESYAGVCDDIKVGALLIFYLQNMVTYKRIDLLRLFLSIEP